MVWVWLIWCTFSAMLLEILVGNHGLFVPCLALMGLYFSVTLGWRVALAPLLLAGVVLDMFLARPYPAFLLLLPVVVFVAGFWRRHGRCSGFWGQAVPGAMVGLVMGAGGVFCERLLSAGSGVFLSWRDVAVAVAAATSAAVLFPVLARGLDSFAARLALPCYHEVQDSDEPAATE